MNKEQFIALGLSEDLAEKAAAASQDELKSFIPKARFDEVNTAKKKAEDDLKDRDKQLDDLKKSVGDSTTLQDQITKLQDENKKAAEKHAAEMKEMKINSAIQSAVKDDAHDPDVILKLLDKTKLTLGDDGKLSGLDEQIKGLRDSSPFLFAEKQANQTFQFRGANPAEGRDNKGGDQGKDQGEFGKRLAEFAKSNEGLDKARASYFE